jgi:(1->4)-alpha-D-glucan 1-alpha-D-glucosylmutase
VNRVARYSPRATYRVQLNKEFTFTDAARVIPYLASLGISHLYVSPILKARPGSMHGYDVTDHSQLNPELGTEEDFGALVDVLHRHDMGLIVDIVPNHLGVLGDDNQWWLDVLENGPASKFARNFDIDWRPNRTSLHDRLLIPVLGQPYGAALEQGEIRVEFDPRCGEFCLRYFEHRFPIDPREYPRIFAGHPFPDSHDEAAADFLSLMNSFAALPARHQLSEERGAERYRDKEAHKRRLTRLIERHPDVLAYINDVLASVNGRVGEASSFDALDELHEAQAYRLAYWRVASEEINYRRFFDVNSLAALRMNDPTVFAATHALIQRLVGEGFIDGLRIDHSDGLFDPEAYFAMLRDQVRTSDAAPLYVVTEKILATHERLPEVWDIQGTTGYEFGALAGAWLVDSAGDAAITKIWRNFVESAPSFEETAYQTRKLVMRIMLAPEVEALATQLDRLAQLDRYTEDFTRPALREAIIEAIASFPVYRTYISQRAVHDEDRRVIEWAISVARKRSMMADVSVFDFLKQMLLVEPQRPAVAVHRPAMLEFAMKFQQVTAPVTAKGVEDTALYRFNRLVCLNEVGSDPRRFGVSGQAVHQENLERGRKWPLAMLATTTHDTKRSEDVRARIAVLSEVPELWRRHLTRWARINRSHRRIVNEVFAPDRHDEFLLYQTLLGVWDPQAEPDAQIARVQEYMVKAAREAKRNTSWLNVDEAYEEGLRTFVATVMRPRERSAFLHDFTRLAEIVSHFGFFNSLSMLALKLCSPGVPDVYQGCEAISLSLVDPDNRRPVDFAAAQQQLAALHCDRRPAHERASDLLAQGWRGNAKLYVTTTLLQVRQRHPALFASGQYEPLTVAGEQREHLIAFARQDDEWRLIVVVARWTCRLLNAELRQPVGEVWRSDAVVELPDLRNAPLHEVLSDRRIAPAQSDERCLLPVSEALACMPLAVFVQSMRER